MSGIAEVQARIADIESRIASFTGAIPGSAVGQSISALTSATGTSRGFADVLSSAAGLVARDTRSVAGSGTTYSSSSATTGEQLLAAASNYLGTPYKWGGTDPATGLDCSGLVQTAAKQLGITLPRTAAQQAKVGTEVPSLAQARPGDLIVLEGGSHIGIFVGNGQMLHAPKAGDVVKVSKIWETPMTIRRLGTTAATGSPTSAELLSSAALLGGSTETSASYVRPASLSAPSSKSARYDAAFAVAEQKYGLPTGLLSAVAKQESGYDPNARSSAGAVGLMQFMPATAKGLGIDPRDPAQAIDGAGRLLAGHVKTFGSVSLALAAYNAGPGNVRKYDGIPPFRETQNYVKKILGTLATSGSTA